MCSFTNPAVVCWETSNCSDELMRLFSPCSNSRYWIPPEWCRGRKCFTMKMMSLPRLPSISYPVKLTVVGTSVGIALIAVLASYFRRRRRRPYRDITEEADVVDTASTASAAPRIGRRYSRKGMGSMMKSPNGGTWDKTLHPILHS